MNNYCLLSEDIERYKDKEPLWEEWVIYLCNNSEYILNNLNSLEENIDSVDYIIDLENKFLNDNNFSKFRKHNKKVISTLKYDSINSNIIDRIKSLNPTAIFADFEVDEFPKEVKCFDQNILNKIIFIRPNILSNKFENKYSNEIFIVNDLINEFDESLKEMFKIFLLHNCKIN